MAPYAKVSFEKPHKTEGNKQIWHFENVDLKELGTLSVEMTLDQFLEHRDMTKLLKENTYQKHTIIKASSTLANQGKNNLRYFKSFGWRLEYRMVWRCGWWWRRWDTWSAHSKRAICWSGSDVVVICCISRICEKWKDLDWKWASGIYTGWNVWRRDVSNTVLKTEAEYVFATTCGTWRVSRRDPTVWKDTKENDGRARCLFDRGNR